VWAVVLPPVDIPFAFVTSPFFSAFYTPFLRYSLPRDSPVVAECRKYAVVHRNHSSN
jgi:hypothetical protein